MSLVVSKEGKHISKINYLPQPQLRKSFPFFAPSQTRCYTWPLWWQWSLSFGFYQVVTRKLKWYSVLYSTGSYRVSTCNYSRGSQYVVEDYFLVLTRWLFAARSDISPSMYILSGRLSQNWTQLLLSDHSSRILREDNSKILTMLKTLLL